MLSPFLASADKPLPSPGQTPALPGAAQDRGGGLGALPSGSVEADAREVWRALFAEFDLRQSETSKATPEEPAEGLPPEGAADFLDDLVQQLGGLSDTDAKVRTLPGWLVRALTPEETLVADQVQLGSSKAILEPTTLNAVPSADDTGTQAPFQLASTSPASPQTQGLLATSLAPAGRVSLARSTDPNLAGESNAPAAETSGTGSQATAVPTVGLIKSEDATIDATAQPRGGLDPADGGEPPAIGSARGETIPKTGVTTDVIAASVGTASPDQARQLLTTKERGPSAGLPVQGLSASGHRSAEENIPTPQSPALPASSPTAEREAFLSPRAAADVEPTRPAQTMDIADRSTLPAEKMLSAGALSAPPPADIVVRSVPMPQLQATVAERIAALTPGAGSERVSRNLDGVANRTVEIELAPADLGRLRLVLHTNERGLHLAVSIERPEMLETVRRHLDGLNRALISEGVTLDSVDIGTGNDRGRSDRSTDQTETSGSAGTDMLDSPEDPHASSPSTRRPDGRLDLSL
jgi:flagellar hook-length control protein FliK